MTERHPRVGVGVVVVRAGRLLLGKRVGSHGAGTWALPGGHLEYGESPAACGRRELLEETGMTARVIVPGPYTSDLFEPEGRHYVTLFVVATDVVGEPDIREPPKCERWEGYRWSAHPAATEPGLMRPGPGRYFPARRLRRRRRPR